MSCRLLSTTFLAALFGLFLIPGQSQAAPQILAVLATETGVPFTCDGEFCRADLSTYCLQRDRPAPQAGTQYLPANTDDFTLTVKTASGKVRNLPAIEHVTFAETRGFMSIAAIIEERQLRRLGSLEATIQVGEQASMLPVPTPGDPDPLTEKEIAYATQSLRSQGSDIVDRRPEAASARVLARVMNSLPQNGPIDGGVLDSAWEQSIGDEFPDGVPATSALPRARAEYGRCKGGSFSRSYGGLRRCLEFRHDELIRDLNIDYWNSWVGS